MEWKNLAILTAFAGTTVVADMHEHHNKKNMLNSERVQISGRLSGYVGYANRNPVVQRFSEKRDGTSDIGLTRADVGLDATVNPMVKAHIELSFHGKGDKLGDKKSNTGTLGFFRSYDSASYRKFQYVNEALITFSGSGDYQSAYIKAGIGYVPFGPQINHRLPQPLTQAMTETQAAMAEVGFQDPATGFGGAFYIFRSEDHKDAAANKSSGRNLNNMGVRLKYDWQDCSERSVGATVDYLFNIYGAVNGLVRNSNAKTADHPYQQRVSAAAITVRGQMQRFDGLLSFASALKKAPIGTKDTAAISAGKRPMTLHLEGGYRMPVMGKNTRLSLSYQQGFSAQLAGSMLAPNTVTNLMGDKAGASGETDVARNALPQNRVVGSWDVEVAPMSNVGFHLMYERPYKGTKQRERATFAGFITASVKLA